MNSNDSIFIEILFDTFDMYPNRKQIKMIHIFIPRNEKFTYTQVSFLKVKNVIIFNEILNDVFLIHFIFFKEKEK